MREKHSVFRVPLCISMGVWFWLLRLVLVGVVVLPVVIRGMVLDSASSSSSLSFRRCVVVGGGPVGLAAALTLSNPPHLYNVTVLEQSQAISKYDPTRAYLYLITPRGLEWMEEFPQALHRLEHELGTESSARDLVVIPADPKTAIDMNKNRGTILTNMTTDGKNPLRSFWVPRHQMIQLLTETCQTQQNEQTPQRKGYIITKDSQRDPNNHNNHHDDDAPAAVVLGSIEVCHGKQVTGISESSPNHGTQAIQVHCSDGSSYDASLLVAADGIDSTVRQILAKEEDQKTSATSSNSWLMARAKEFKVKRYKSPSSGIKMKCLQFPPNFTLTNTDGTRIQTTSTNIYAIRSVNRGTQRLSLGLLPNKDPTLIRPANINTRYNHKIWSITNGKDMKAYFQSSFPRIVWEDIITNDAEWERFAKAKGTTYPMPQYSPGSAQISPHNHNVGIVLVGDACHAFPPDIGQGINSGLNDIVALDRSLQGQDIVTGRPIASAASKPKQPCPTLYEALKHYQENRRPEHRALIRLARFGAPYQYRQSWFRDRIGAALWMVNATVRLILNKLSFGLVPPVAIASVFATTTTTTTPNNNNPSTYQTYRHIMQRADATTNILTGTAVVGIIAWMAKRMMIASSSLQ